MASDLYCNRGDVNALASAGEITGSSRLAGSATATSDTFELDGHGFETDDELTVRAAEGGALPAPLVEGTTYYAIRLTNASFQVAATAGGAAINLTSDGESVFVIKDPPYDATIEEWSRWADSFLPAHAVPLATPLGAEWALVRRLVAKLTAFDLFRLEGKRSETFAEVKLEAVRAFERLATGVPVRGDTGTRTNLAISSPSTSTTDTRGWGSGSLP